MYIKNGLLLLIFSFATSICGFAQSNNSNNASYFNLQEENVSKYIYQINLDLFANNDLKKVFKTKVFESNIIYSIDSNVTGIMLIAASKSFSQSEIENHISDLVNQTISINQIDSGQINKL